jgi:hypothetical protein
MINIITGAKIQNLSDHFIGTDLTYTGIIDETRFIDISSINEAFDNKMNIYCPTHITRDLELLIEKLKFMKNKFNLILHNSDDNFDPINLKLFDIPNLLQIYTQNMNVIHPNVFPLSIALQNEVWIPGQEKIINDLINENIAKDKLIYFYFNIQTNPHKRQICYDICKNKNIENAPYLGFKDYMRELSRYKFCVCPEGNIDCKDTHRFWECLYMKVVPIVIRNSQNEYYSQYFPVILLNDWSELDIDKLDNFKPIWENDYMLDMSYMEKYIKNSEV